MKAAQEEGESASDVVRWSPGVHPEDYWSSRRRERGRTLRGRRGGATRHERDYEDRVERIGGVEVRGYRDGLPLGPH
ncbi:hypothetical protein [Natronorarus salvus]|uniref:hypothetical protein n=1 Tax=Natronorarus salvus TaxID=3117733 RepID=UPI002F26033D